MIRIINSPIRIGHSHRVWSKEIGHTRTWPHVATHTWRNWSHTPRVSTTASSRTSRIRSIGSELAYNTRVLFPEAEDRKQLLYCLGINVLSVMSYVVVAPCLGRVIDVISAPQSTYGMLAKAVGTLTLAYVLSNTTLAAQVQLASSVGERLASRVRSRLFRSIMWKKIDSTDSGTMISWLGNDVNVLQATVTKLLGARGIRSGLETVGIICVLLWLNWVLALMLLISAPILTPVVLSAASRMKMLAQDVQVSTAATSSAAMEILEDQKVIKVNQAEKSQIDRYNSLVDDQSRMNTKSIVAASLLDVSGRLRNVFCVVLTVGLGAHLALMNQVTVGTCYSFFIYGFGFAFALSNVAQSVGEIFKVVGTMKEVVGLIDCMADPVEVGGYAVPDVIESIEFRNVSFRHPDDGWEMKNMSFTMRSKTTTALVGPSGGGKSTIALLLLGFYTPVSGEIWINGNIPLSKVDKTSWRKKIGMVEQRPGLLVGTVSHVVSYGKDDASDDAILDMLRQTQAYPNFVESLDDVVTANTISGGQGQRLALARALLRKPDVLVLDEATSALDVDTENRILECVNVDRDMPITLVIAHRLNTVREADTIIVIADGQIVEMGTHDELLLLNESDSERGSNSMYARYVDILSSSLDE